MQGKTLTLLPAPAPAANICPPLGTAGHIIGGRFITAGFQIEERRLDHANLGEPGENGAGSFVMVG